MNCALCLQDRPLCRSHVIPEFMFKSMYDERHSFWEMSSRPERPSKSLRKGLRERLLCEPCERQLSKYEDYASQVFFGNAAKQPTRLKNGLSFSGLKYKPLKLFFMSLLWRFSVTNQPAYGKTELGPHKEKLRQLIQSDEPGDVVAYPCLVSAITMEGKYHPDLIIPPVFTRLQGSRIWAFVAAGYLFHFFVSSSAPPQGFSAAFLQIDGRFFLHIVDYRESRFVADWLAKMGAAERARQKS